MRLLAFCLVLLVAGLAVAQGITLNTGLRTELTDCASGGSSSSTLTGNVRYLMRVTDSDVFLCLTATCATGGERFPSGTVLLYQVPNGGHTISCRSAASTGDIIFTAVQ